MQLKTLPKRLLSRLLSWRTATPTDPRQQYQQTSPMSESPQFEELMPPRPLSLPPPVFGIAQRTNMMEGFTLESTTTHRTWRTTKFIQNCHFGKVMLAMEVTEPALAGQEGANAAARPPVYFAIKEIRADNLEKKQGKTLDDPLREVSVMQYMNAPHENVVQCTEALKDKGGIYIVTPYYNGGDVFDMKEKKGCIPEVEARSIFIQVVHALIHLKKSGVCHRDVSLENLVMHEGIVKLIDLGVALHIPQTADGRARVLPPQGSCGKQGYMSPEVALDKGDFDGFAADVWSLGVMLFEMVAGRPPFEISVPSLDERCKVIAVEGRLGELVEAWNMSLSQNVVDLMQSCLRVDPANRAPLETLRNHRWVTG